MTSVGGGGGLFPHLFGAMHLVQLAEGIDEDGIGTQGLRPLQKESPQEKSIYQSYE